MLNSKYFTVHVVLQYDGGISKLALQKAEESLSMKKMFTIDNMYREKLQYLEEYFSVFSPLFPS